MSIRHPFGWDLPPGVINKMIDDQVKVPEDDCPDCEGTGKIDRSECCDAPLTESGLCHQCKDHSEPYKCDTCNGTGKVVSQPLTERPEE